MPVILEGGSNEIRTWLDPTIREWSRDLQTLLKPYNGDLDCYPVSSDVGKVGNDSPSLLIPVNRKEPRSKIADFFSKPTESKSKEDHSSHSHVDETIHNRDQFPQIQEMSNTHRQRGGGNALDDIALGHDDATKDVRTGTKRTNVDPHPSERPLKKGITANEGSNYQSSSSNSRSTLYQSDPHTRHQAARIPRERAFYTGEPPTGHKAQIKRTITDYFRKI